MLLKMVQPLLSQYPTLKSKLAGTGRWAHKACHWERLLSLLCWASAQICTWNRKSCNERNQRVTLGLVIFGLGHLLHGGTVSHQSKVPTSLSFLMGHFIPRASCSTLATFSWWGSVSDINSILIQSFRKL